MHQYGFNANTVAFMWSHYQTWDVTEYSWLTKCVWKWMGVWNIKVRYYGWTPAVLSWCIFITCDVYLVATCFSSSIPIYSFVQLFDYD